ncbi:type I-MYXAN CRISPR-associated protein Cas6/Cmx6 [Myxococcus sp. RHSTA-1-4]|uniref:type I-MYXAN CRISPR-associated protein Cas6/Cmx6 n=1 Tax=Myxococcus sp. RHSTA-1-4 TaxID=2874601 RepID=UPI001CBD39CE|nr:type I-MYXAN CRISPR-associated protein Cas6/Cmx6 [Myxococcus sp. RHSTA-1-4]MBZ4423282.1 type I-MYXAN CRISPR-associated protein Cas6/Cmx6 [Myxococcus sp. RHSTA-1-4]
MPAIDLLFPVRGGPVPLDHGYLLFSALSARLPGLHERRDIGIFNLRGESATRELLHLGRGTLRLRCPAEALPLLLPLVSAPLEVAGRHLTLGAPTLRPLEPVSSLSARAVTFKHALDEATFHAAALRFLAELGCQARLKVGRRRVVAIAGKKVVGFALDVEGLSGEHSLLLQEQGLGGRRHMGCGLFLPTRPAARSITPFPVRGRAAA